MVAIACAVREATGMDDPLPATRAEFAAET